MMKDSKITYYTVAKLIKSLKQFPQDMLVVVSGYEGGYENILPLKIEKLTQNPDNPYWEGEFQELEEQDAENSVEAVVLRRLLRDV